MAHQNNLPGDSGRSARSAKFTRLSYTYMHVCTSPIAEELREGIYKLVKNGDTKLDAA